MRADKVTLAVFSATYTRESSTENGVTIRRGNAPISNVHDLPEVHGFAWREAWADRSYRGVWTSAEYLAIITFCEGDITIERNDSQADYDKAIARCGDFYDEGK